jgi:hypothetical protein
VEEAHVRFLLDELVIPQVPETLRPLVRLLHSVCKVTKNREIVFRLDGAEVILQKLLEDMTSEISGELILVLEMLVTDETASARHK